MRRQRPWNFEDELDAHKAEGIVCEDCDEGPFEWCEGRNPLTGKFGWYLVTEEGEPHACPKIYATDHQEEFENLDAAPRAGKAARRIRGVRTAQTQES